MSVMSMTAFVCFWLCVCVGERERERICVGCSSLCINMCVYIRVCVVQACLCLCVFISCLRLDVRKSAASSKFCGWWQYNQIKDGGHRVGKKDRMGKEG